MNFKIARSEVEEREEDEEEGLELRAERQRICPVAHVRLDLRPGQAQMPLVGQELVW